MSIKRVRTGRIWLGVVLAVSYGCSRRAASPSGEHTRTGERAVASRSRSVRVVEGIGGKSDRSYKLGDGLSVQNLTVWPVQAAARTDVGTFVTLAEAESRGMAKVREKGGSADSGAEVNQLVVENRGSDPILICAGTVLKGGQQDRQVARDHVIGPRTTQPLEAFCIEQGRWTALREGRATAGVFTSTGVVANKRVRASAQYLADQSQVWANVSKVNAYTQKSPRTATFLATVEDGSHGSLQRRGELEEAVRKHFEDLRQSGAVPVGFAYAINGEPLTMRTFASADLFQQHFPPFRKAMCVEADVIQRRDIAEGHGVHSKEASADLMLEMIAAIDAGKPLPILESTVWRILRRSSDRGGMSALWVRRGLRPGAAWVELTTDWTAPVEYEAHVRDYLESLRALGYTR